MYISCMNRLLLLTILAIFWGIGLSGCGDPSTDHRAMVSSTLQDTLLQMAQVNLEAEPITVTASFCERSEGGVHDIYSEGDYWWPDPQHPGSPSCVRRDGLTNPANFTNHRKGMIRFSEIVGNLLPLPSPHHTQRIQPHRSIHDQVGQGLLLCAGDLYFFGANVLIGTLKRSESVNLMIERLVHLAKAF